MAHNSKETNETHYCGIGLHNPLNGFNIGSALRAAGAFKASFMAVSGNRYKERNSSYEAMDTELARKRLPLFLGVPSLEPFVPVNADVVLLEKTPDAINLVDFQHSRRCVYIFGAEDNQVPILNVPNKIHRVYIPSEYSLNLAACVYMTLYDRIAKSKSFQVANITCPKCHSDHNKNLPEATEKGTLGYHCNACGHEWEELSS